MIIHLACKDWNRNALESRGWQLNSAGFHNVLAMSGDSPSSVIAALRHLFSTSTPSGSSACSRR